MSVGPGDNIADINFGYTQVAAADPDDDDDDDAPDGGADPDDDAPTDVTADGAKRSDGGILPTTGAEILRLVMWALTIALVGWGGVETSHWLKRRRR